MRVRTPARSPWASRPSRASSVRAFDGTPVAAVAGRRHRGRAGLSRPGRRRRFGTTDRGLPAAGRSGWSPPWRRRRVAARRRARLRVPRARRFSPSQYRGGCTGRNPDQRRRHYDPQGQFWARTLADDHRQGGGAPLPARYQRADGRDAGGTDDLQRHRLGPDGGPHLSTAVRASSMRSRSTVAAASSPTSASWSRSPTTSAHLTG